MAVRLTERSGAVIAELLSVTGAAYGAGNYPAPGHPTTCARGLDAPDAVVWLII